MYTKTINPAYEQVGKRQRLSGFVGELHDGELLIHAQEYSTNSQAEQALDSLVFELLSDLADQGMVDDVPAAMEAEHVSSTHLPSWQDDLCACGAVATLIVRERSCESHICGLCFLNDYENNHENSRAWTVEPLAVAPPGFPDDDDDGPDGGGPPRAFPTCMNCKGPHHGWQCPEIGDLLFAEPVVVVMDVEYAPFGFAA